MTHHDLSGAIFRKSSRSNNGGNCVEVADNLEGIVAVRDSKDNGHGPVLVFSQETWENFTAGVKAGTIVRS